MQQFLKECNTTRVCAYARTYTQDKSTMFSHLHAHVLLGTWLKHLFTEENLEMGGFFHREDQPIARYKWCSHDLICLPETYYIQTTFLSLAQSLMTIVWLDKQTKVTGVGKTLGFNSFFFFLSSLTYNLGTVKKMLKICRVYML